MRKYKLAVIAPYIGAPTETFINRHLSDLAPGRTIVIVNQIHPLCSETSWDFPVFDISNIWNRFHYKALRKIAQRLNIWGRHHRFVPLRSILKRHGVDVILGEYLNFTHPLIKIIKDLNIRLFAHAHGYDISRLLLVDKWKRKYFDYNLTEGVITINQESRTRLLQIGLKPDKIHLIPYGVNTSPVPQERKNGKIIKCLAAGRIIQKKSPLNLLESFRRALKKNKNLHLDYIGDGELLPKVRQFIQDRAIEDKVTLHGAQPNSRVLDLMKKSDIFLQHSITHPDTGETEGLPVAILEAMAHALPVVSTNHAGIPEAQVNGQTGFLVEEGDVRGMAEYICKLADDYPLRKKMGKSAWERAQNKYSWDIERTNLIKLLKL